MAASEFELPKIQCIVGVSAGNPSDWMRQLLRMSVCVVEALVHVSNPQPMTLKQS